jgi:hypothetical protein
MAGDQLKIKPTTFEMEICGITHVLYAAQTSLTLEPTELSCSEGRMSHVEYNADDIPQT